MASELQVDINLDHQWSKKTLYVRPIKWQFASFKPKIALITTKYSENVCTKSEYSKKVHMFRELFQKRMYGSGINS